MQKGLDLNISLAIFYTKTIFIYTDMELTTMLYHREHLETCKTERIM